MKVSALIKIIVKEFKRDLFLSVLLLALVDFIYANFTGIPLTRESGTILVLSHILYYCFAGFYPEQAASAFSYLMLDCLGFPSVMILYFILNHCRSLDNSYLYILGIYMLNTVLPIPILPAMATVKFFTLKSRTEMVPLCLLLMGTDLIAVVYYNVLIKRRRVSIC